MAGVRKGAAVMPRCDWAGTDPTYVAYHDQEWGVPEHDDRRLLEFLVLGGMQAGLSWVTILRKRERFRRAFAGFHPDQVARFDGRNVRTLVADPGLVRNRRKIMAAIGNARAVTRIQEEFGSFDAYVWRFVGGAPRQNSWRSMREVPTFTPAAVTMSTDLRGRGFSFVGPTICYAFMQATGMVNDHVVSCFRHRQLGGR